jgi:phage shock protein C
MSKLYRSRSDRYITGLCGGLGESFGIDSTWIRLLLVITAFFSGGVIIPLYFLAVIVIPKEPRNGGPFGPGYGYEGGGAPGWETNAGPDWGKQWGSEWGKHWGGKKHGCGSHRHRRNSEAQYEQNGTRYQSQQGNNQSKAGSDLDDMMKDIEKKAMWKEIEELRVKVAQYEKNQQTKGDV